VPQNVYYDESDTENNSDSVEGTPSGQLIEPTTILTPEKHVMHFESAKELLGEINEPIDNTIEVEENLVNKNATNSEDDSTEQSTTVTSAEALVGASKETFYLPAGHGMLFGFNLDSLHLHTFGNDRIELDLLSSRPPFDPVV